VTRTLVLCDVDLAAYEAEFRAGRRTSRQPYGMDRLEELGHRLESVPVREGRVVTALEHRTGVRFARALSALRRAGEADLVLAMLEHWALAPGLLSRVPGTGYRRRPLVSVVCWAAEDLRTGTDHQRRPARAILRDSDLVCYWSDNQTEVFLEHGASPDRLLSLTFGTETAYFGADPGLPRDLDVLAVGVDRGRDYATLARAMTGSDVRVQVLARPANLAGVALPPNVDVIGTVPQHEYAAMLRRARVVVVPTHELAYPTGQTVALDAAAAGAAVIVTSTPAMREYFSDGVTALMPAPGDAAGLRRAVETLADDEPARLRLAHAGHRHVLAHHDSAVMWDQLDQALVERGWRS
jgi:glycosyltransferase involved in cell wall biosynthesis